MSKKITIGAKPTVQSPSASAEEWVSNRNIEHVQPVETQKMKRLTIDVTEGLHRRIKTACAARGTKMADEIRDLLEKHFS